MKATDRLRIYGPVQPMHRSSYRWRFVLALAVFVIGAGLGAVG